MSDWQPARITTPQHLQSHHKDSGLVTAHAGKIIRVRPVSESEPTLENIRALMHLYLGCSGNFLVVHPEDAAMLWPDKDEPKSRVVICEHSVMTD